MKTLRKWDDERPLRKWQAQAIRRFYALNKRDFLTVGTPGSGKTDYALKIAHDLSTDGKIERVVVVAPTEHLKRQWAESAARCGIDIDPDWTNANGCEAKDYFGAAVTYQQKLRARFIRFELLAPDFGYLRRNPSRRRRTRLGRQTQGCFRQCRSPCCFVRNAVS